MEGFELIERESQSMLDRAREIVVTSDEEYTLAGEFVMGAKALVKKITEAHESNIDRWHQGHKAAIADRDVMLSQVNDALTIASGVALTYKKDQDRLAKEEADRVAADKKRADDEARLKEAERLEAEGKTKEAEEVLDAPPPPEPRRHTRFISPTPKVAGLSDRTSWKAQVVDPKSVKRQFCTPDQTLINFHVNRFWPKGTPSHKKVLTDEQKKLLENEIGGVEIYEESTFVGRVGSL